MVHTLSLFLAAASAITAVSAHAAGEPAPAHWRRDNIASRADLEARCGAQLEARRRKRALQATNNILAKRAPHKRNVLPRATESNESTCLITPEVTQGPYHILGEIVRQNITEGQAGVPLEVSIDLIDITTCEPVQAWIDAWHANATGYYSGYISETGASIAGGSGGTGGGGGDMSMSGSMSDMPSGSGGAGGASATGSADATSTSLGAYSGADSVSAASQLDQATGDNSTFLRGVYQSDEDGNLVMYSIVPGWYSGRAQHFHVKVYPEGYIASNGTFVGNSSAVHTGQFFFDNDTLTAVAATDIYAANAIAWSDAVANDDDMWYPYQNAIGYNADMDITWVSDDILDGLVGSITLGLNLSYASPELSTQYQYFDLAGYEASSLVPSASSSGSASSSDSSSAADASSSSSSGVSSFDSFFVRAIGGILGDWY